MSSYRRVFEQYRKAEMTRAVVAGAVTRASYRKLVVPDDPKSVDSWLDVAVPQILRANLSSANDAAKFYDLMRRVEISILEIDDADDFKAEPVTNSIDEGVRHSLASAGKEGAGDQWDSTRMNDKKVAGVAMRHVLDGGRATMDHNSTRDKSALGWVRVTDGNPCAFCAMLASRGITYRPYKQGAFKASNARYVGHGNSKVHDFCGCSLKPVWSESDPFVTDTEKFSEMWREMAGNTTQTAFKEFRKNYTAAGHGKRETPRWNLA